MKSLFCFVLFLFAVGLVSAQDTIVKRNGDSIIAKLAEINPDDIRYKRFDYLDGPLFRLPKEEVKLVIYSNGKRELFEDYVAATKTNENIKEVDRSMQTTGKYFYYMDRRIAEPDMLDVVLKLNDKKLNQMVKKVNEVRYAQDISMLLGVTLFVSGAFVYATNRPMQGGRGKGKGGPPTNTSSRAQAQQNAKLMMLGGLISGIASVSFMIDRRKRDRFVVNAYNAFIVKR